MISVVEQMNADLGIETLNSEIAKSWAKESAEKGGELMDQLVPDWQFLVDLSGFGTEYYNDVYHHVYGSWFDGVKITEEHGVDYDRRVTCGIEIPELANQDYRQFLEDAWREVIKSRLGIL